MKKICMVLMLCLISIMFYGCIYLSGDIKKVSIVDVKSDIYSDDDIKAGEKVVLDYFHQNFKGCTLTELEYIGDDRNNDYLEGYQGTNVKEVMVFISDFSVDSFGANNGLNPNSTYKGFNWILVRDENGNWRHSDHGYG